MRKFWSGLARFTAVVFSIAFVLTASLALVLTSIDRSLFNASLYKTALKEQKVYARLPRILAEQLVVTMNSNPCAENPLRCENTDPKLLECAQKSIPSDRYTSLLAGQALPTEAELAAIRACQQALGAAAETLPAQGAPAFMKTINVGDWEAVIAEVVPQDVLQTTTENLLDGIFAYLNGRQDSVALNLAALKNRLSGQGGLDAILKLIRAQKACTPQDAEALLAALSSGSSQVNLCRPPEDVLALASPFIRSQLDAYLARLPDQVVLLSPETGENSGSSTPAGSGGLQAGVQFVRLVMRLSPNLALAVLLLISLLVVRSLKGWLRWWGVPVFFSGVLSLVYALSLSASFEQGWVEYLASRIPSTISLGMINLAHDLARSVLQSWAAGLNVSSLLLGALGLVLWVCSALIKSGAPGQAAVPTEAA